MTSGKWALGICDNCGQRRNLHALKKSSYGTLVCSECYDGSFDINNHPQNKPPRIREREYLRNPRPEDYRPAAAPSIISIGYPQWLNLDTGEVTIIE